MASYNIVISPVHYQWRYHSLATKICLYNQISMKLKSMPLTAGTILRNLAVGAWFWVCIWWAVSETSTAKLRQESQHCVLAECPQWGQVVGVWGSHYPPPRGKGCPPVLLSRSPAEWWAPPPLIQVGTHLWPRMAAKGLVGTHVHRHTPYTWGHTTNVTLITTDTLLIQWGYTTNVALTTTGMLHINSLAQHYGNSTAV